MRFTQLVGLNRLGQLGGLQHQGREVFQNFDDDAAAVPIHHGLTDQGTQRVDVHGNALFAIKLRHIVAVSGVKAMPGSDKTSVLLVCLGNICRSPAAEGVLRRRADELGLGSALHIDSAGTAAYHVGSAPDRRMQQAAARRSVDLSQLRARQVTPQDFSEFDYILAMDQSNLQALKRIRPASARGHLGLFLALASQGGRALEVPDPYYGGEDGFERVLDMVDHGARAFLAYLQASQPDD